MNSPQSTETCMHFILQAVRVLRSVARFLRGRTESLRKELHGCFQHTLLEDLRIQLPWMAPKDTYHFPHRLLPMLNDRFQNSMLPSIFSNSEHLCVFIHKNCQCAICTNMAFIHHLWLHKWYNHRCKITLKNLGCTDVRWVYFMQVQHSF